MPMNDSEWEEYLKYEEEARKEIKVFCAKINAQRRKEYLKKYPPYKVDLSNHTQIHGFECA